VSRNLLIISAESDYLVQYENVIPIALKVYLDPPTLSIISNGSILNVVSFILVIITLIKSPPQSSPTSQSPKKSCCVELSNSFSSSYEQL